LLGGPCVHIADTQGTGRAELGLAARDLNRLERYERRALSGRKRAIETFMAINHVP